MEEKITLSMQAYKNLLDNETRTSILYAEFLKGNLDIDFVAKVMGWEKPIRKFEESALPI